MMMAIPELHSKKQVIKLVVMIRRSAAVPGILLEGREPANDGEVVLDRVSARPARLLTSVIRSALPDTNSPWLTVQSDGILVGTLVFARKTFVESVALAPGEASFILVTPAAGTTSAGIGRRAAFHRARTCC
jgi:hypothetical protein